MQKSENFYPNLDTWDEQLGEELNKADTEHQEMDTKLEERGRKAGNWR